MAFIGTVRIGAALVGLVGVALLVLRSPGAVDTLGLIGAPLLIISSTGSLFGGWEQVSGVGLALAFPIAAWEFSVGVYMTVKGFRTPPAVTTVAEPAVNGDEAAPALAHA